MGPGATVGGDPMAGLSGRPSSRRFLGTLSNLWPNYPAASSGNTADSWTC